MLLYKLDIRDYDTRVLAAMQSHPVEEMRHHNWIILYQGNVKNVQLEYLRHMGQQLYFSVIDRKLQPHQPAPEEMLQQARDAMNIMSLFLELNNSETRGSAENMRLFMTNLQDIIQRIEEETAQNTSF